MSSNCCSRLRSTRLTSLSSLLSTSLPAATSIRNIPPSTTTANRNSRNAMPTRPVRRWNAPPQYGQRPPLSNEMRAQFGHRR
jgi:hypothetical protein